MKWWYKKRPKAWIEWRAKVYLRDNYKCVMCGRSGLRLDPHHILPKRDYPNLKYHISNGASLCRRCHKKTFKKEYQFIEQLVDKIFGGQDKWKLFQRSKTPRKKAASKSTRSTKVGALQ